MRLLVIGSSGQLGSELTRTFADCDVTGLDHSAIEIEDNASVEAAFTRVQPTVVINTAAYHNVDQCEQNPERAFAVNATAVERLSAASERIGAAFATMSSDYVFAGDLGRPYAESDEPSPLNAYGASKRAGELSALARPRSYVFRTSGMYGLRTSTQKGHMFVDRIIKQAQSGETPRVVTDVVYSPSYAIDVAWAIRQVLEREAFGLYHVTNAGHCSWFEYATEALRLTDLPTHMTPASYRDFASNVKRPTYSALAHERLGRIGITMPTWQDGLRRYITSRLAASVE
jgi:dTDP-4-dehydrorhamnose reductase